MDSTKKLCHKLDELGVEYVSIGGITNWGHAEYDELADGSDTRLIVLGATPEQAIAATVGERNPDGLPIGLTVSNDGNLLNWVGENYVRQDAATVGRGNLTAEQVREAIMSADRWRKPMGDTGMTNTHLIIRDDGWQAIADELNATMGAGTCHIEVNDNLAETEGMGDVWLECDECHWQMPLEPTTPRFKHCPNCGARIIKEESA